MIYNIYGTQTYTSKRGNSYKALRATTSVIAGTPGEGVEIAERELNKPGRYGYLENWVRSGRIVAERDEDRGIQAGEGTYAACVVLQKVQGTADIDPQVWGSLTPICWTEARNSAEAADHFYAILTPLALRQWQETGCVVQ